MATNGGPKVTRSGLEVKLDAAQNALSNSWKGVGRKKVNAGFTNSPTKTRGREKGRFSLDNSSDQSIYVTHDLGIDVSTDYYSIEIWFRLNTLPTADYGDNTPIYGDRQGSNYMIFCYPASGGKSNLGVCYDDSRYNSNHRSTYSISAGEWVQFVHVGIPYSGARGKLKYYINGELDRSEFISSDSSGYSVPNTLYVGRDNRYGVNSDLDIGIIKHYGKEITAEEVKQNFYAHKSRFGI